MALALVVDRGRLPGNSQSVFVISNRQLYFGTQFQAGNRSWGRNVDSRRCGKD